jgi:hypothetical protein
MTDIDVTAFHVSDARALVTQEHELLDGAFGPILAVFSYLRQFTNENIHAALECVVDPRFDLELPDFPIVHFRPAPPTLRCLDYLSHSFALSSTDHSVLVAQALAPEAAAAMHTTSTIFTSRRTVCVAISLHALYGFSDYGRETVRSGSGIVSVWRFHANLVSFMAFIRSFVPFIASAGGDHHPSTLPPKRINRLPLQLLRLPQAPLSLI